MQRRLWSPYALLTMCGTSGCFSKAMAHREFLLVPPHDCMGEAGPDAKVVTVLCA